jgi:hypothetical protein
VLVDELDHVRKAWTVVMAAQQSVELDLGKPGGEITSQPLPRVVCVEIDGVDRSLGEPAAGDGGVETDHFELKILSEAAHTLEHSAKVVANPAPGRHKWK